MSTILYFTSTISGSTLNELSVLEDGLHILNSLNRDNIGNTLIKLLLVISLYIWIGVRVAKYGELAFCPVVKINVLSIRRLEVLNPGGNHL